jgi:hypothetical protein
MNIEKPITIFAMGFATAALCFGIGYSKPAAAFIGILLWFGIIAFRLY